jgi:acyl carrier protein
MFPAHIVLLDALPLTTNGKVDRAALPGFRRPRQKLPAKHIPPRTPIEAAIAAIWEEVLEIAPIGTHDDFLMIGGDSIAAARIANEVLAVFQVDLSVRALFDVPTIAQMADLIARR